LGVSESTEDNLKLEHSYDLDNSNTNKIFGQDMNSSNREHILVSDLSANDDSNRLFMKENNIEIENVNICEDLNGLRNDNFKPVQKMHSHI
jgi:hypothetical protein